MCVICVCVCVCQVYVFVYVRVCVLYVCMDVVCMYDVCMILIAQYVAQRLKQMISPRKQCDPLTFTIEMHPCLKASHKPGPTKMLRLKQNTKNVKNQKECNSRLDKALPSQQ